MFLDQCVCNVLTAGCPSKRFGQQFLVRSYLDLGLSALTLESECLSDHDDECACRLSAMHSRATTVRKGGCQVGGEHDLTCASAAPFAFRGAWHDCSFLRMPLAGALPLLLPQSAATPSFDRTFAQKIPGTTDSADQSTVIYVLSSSHAGYKDLRLCSAASSPETNLRNCPELLPIRCHLPQPSH